MADAVTSRTLLDGPKTTVMKFTNISDGTGESAVQKVDASALQGAPSSLKITRVWFATAGMSVRILFDATADVLALLLPPDQCDCLDFRSIGGIGNNAGAGKTGDILFTTVGHTAGDTYDVILELAKS